MAGLVEDVWRFFSFDLTKELSSDEFLGLAEVGGSVGARSLAERSADGGTSWR